MSRTILALKTVVQYLQLDFLFPCCSFLKSESQAFRPSLYKLDCSHGELMTLGHKNNLILQILYEQETSCH